jgi:amino acid transporter
MAKWSDDDDARALSKLGYAQELVRAMGGFSSFALSFSIISVLTGILTTYKAALAGGGPAAAGLGWPIVSAGALLVALAMAELASAFPTAGALYHWSALLGGPGWGWLTAAMNLVGQCAIVAGVDLGCADMLRAVLGLPQALTLPVLLVVLTSHAVLNAVSVRVVAWLNDLSATVHIVGVVVLVALLFAIGRSHGFGYLAETGFTTRPDGRYPLGFANGMLLGMWTFTGFDASAHVSEETHDPERRAPIGIVSSVAVSAVAGYALVAALTLAVVDLRATAADDQPALFVMRTALGKGWGDLAMALGVVAMWFCGLSSVTSASRTIFAFSRDGGLPFSGALRAVSPRFRTPVRATIAAVAAPLVLVLATMPFSDEVLVAVTSLAASGLYVSYATPIALGIAARRAGRWRRMGPWTLGRWGLPVALLAVAWTGAVVAVCALPPHGLGGAILGAVVALLLVAYAALVRGRFRGPKVRLAALEGRAPGD